MIGIDIIKQYCAMNNEPQEGYRYYSAVTIDTGTGLSTYVGDFATENVVNFLKDIIRYDNGVDCADYFTLTEYTEFYENLKEALVHKGITLTKAFRNVGLTVNSLTPKTIRGVFKFSLAKEICDKAGINLRSLMPAEALSRYEELSVK